MTLENNPGAGNAGASADHVLSARKNQGRGTLSQQREQDPALVCAKLHVRRTAPQPGRRYFYSYDVEFDGQLIVIGSIDPEPDLARALLELGIVGVVVMLDGITGKPRTIIQIENAAKVRTSEEDRDGLRWRKHRETPADGTYSPETGVLDRRQLNGSVATFIKGGE